MQRQTVISGCEQCNSLNSFVYIKGTGKVKVLRFKQNNNQNNIHVFHAMHTVQIYIINSKSHLVSNIQKIFLLYMHTK